MKKNFAEPEMEVVRFNAQEIVTATSGCQVDNDGCPIEGEFIPF